MQNFKGQNINLTKESLEPLKYVFFFPSSFDTGIYLSEFVVFTITVENIHLVLSVICVCKLKELTLN